MTPKQQRAMWKYYTLLADALNDAGWDMKKVLKEEVEIPWNKDMVHDFLWMPIQEIMLKKDSTMDMNTADPQKIYEVLNRHIASKFGVSVPWPEDKPGVEAYEDGHGLEAAR